MLNFQADSSNFVKSLQKAEDGDEICLKPGEYKGPFTIERSITIRGNGEDTVIFAADEPALLVKVPGVRIENLAIARTVGGDKGEVAIFAEAGTSPILERVKLTGIAENVCWENASWNIPAVLDFGEVESDRLVQRCWELQIGAPCEIVSNLSWLHVQPTYLSPGLQNLEFELNARDIPAGTNLSGCIFLQTENERRELEISAKIVCLSQNNIQLKKVAGLSGSRVGILNNIATEDWGYRLVSEKAIDKIIREMEGKDAIYKYTEFNDRRERANQLLSELFDMKSYLFYLRRLKQGKEPGEEKWELTIATDRNDSKLPKILAESEKTLRLEAFVKEDGNGGLRLVDASFVPLSIGRADGFTVPYRICPLPARQYRKDVPPTALARMAKMPFCLDYAPTEKQLEAWKKYVELERRLAESRQFCVPFVSHNYGSATRWITFKINPAEASIDGSRENYIDENDFWKRALQARSQEVKLLQNSPESKNGRDNLKLGKIAEVDFEDKKIRVMLDSDLLESLTEEKYKLPATGSLFFDAFGEISQINHKERALKDLQEGRTQNRYLGEFFFDVSQARSPKKIIELKPQDLLLSSANTDQIAAVETVLSAQDIVLIQGPPGTGKTTVIAEICYQVALRGGRTLIASQTNLAVDNALSRLVHSPHIRALRKGKADKVQEEGQPFLEDNAIGTWLQKTATDCENNLNKRHENIQILRQLLINSERFSAYIQVEKEQAERQKGLQEKQVNLEKKCRAIESDRAQADAEKHEVKSLILGLDLLLENAPKVDWEDATVTNFLPRLQPYAAGESTVENFLTNVKIARKLAIELGFVLPARGAFGLAAWFVEVLAVEICQVQIALDCANEAVEAIATAAEAVQIYQQNNAYLTQIQKNYGEIITKQQNIEGKFQKLKSREAEIQLLIQQIRSWLSTGESRVYQALQKCLQYHQIFSDKLIELPPGLVAIAQSINLPLVPPDYSCNYIDMLPNWEQLNKALSYEEEGGFVDRRGNQYRFSEFLQMSLKQPPIVLSNSDRVSWQQLTEKFITYQRLTLHQRQSLIQHTRQFLTEMQHIYSACWQPNNIELTLNRVAKELLDSILTNARQCVFPVKAQTEQKIQHLKTQLDEFEKIIADRHNQISATQEQVEIAEKNAELKVDLAIHLLQKFSQLPQVPENLRILAKQYLRDRSYVWQQPTHFSEQVHNWENLCRQLESAISSLEPFAVLAIIKKRIETLISSQQEKAEITTSQLQELQAELLQIRETLAKNISENLITERNWWQQAWQEIPDRFKPQLPSTGLFDLKFLRKIQNQFDAWQQQLQQEETYLDRYQNFVQAWIEKLRHPSEQDRNDLKKVYLDNANAIGITCVQAAGGNFSKEFPNFDVVIIDEVSKCTPPELLIPALKGKKIVLVGDHRQLPPMLNENTVEDIAKEINSTAEELSFLEESLFKLQFESAAPDIKRMLTTQYRMHPNIMGAINQFYEGKLQCGILDYDTKRAHHLAGEVIQENHHLIWVKMPLVEGYEEAKEGTSFFNVKEVDAIERLCQQMEKAWSAKFAETNQKKEIGIITFYGSQLRLIDERIDPTLFPSLQIRTGTVDRFQGMERQVIIVSMVRNNREGKVGFAKKTERVNVAFSRARELLVIVGCHSLFTQHPGTVGNMYSQVSNVVRRQGGMIDVSNILS